MKNLRIRKNIRLSNFDYSQNGMYFVTICTKDREEFFGKIEKGRLVLNEVGMITKECLLETPKHLASIFLDRFAIMPNHVHYILEIIHNKKNVGNALVRSGNKKDKTKMLLSKAVHGFKSAVTRKTNQLGAERIYAFPTKFQWQKSFYDHIIRNEIELNKIREYIIKNPKMWERDRNNIENIWI